MRVAMIVTAGTGSGDPEDQSHLVDASGTA
jgi:hypothetical protein